MSLKISNTLTRKKEKFNPIDKGKINMYVCGVTVYDDCHIGHARSAIVFDLIRKYLKFRGFEVKFVKNITDIDDKIIQRARNLKKVSSANKNLKELCKDIVDRYLKRYYTDMEKLSVEPPDIEPKATEHILEIIDIVKKLIKNGYAYQSGQSVYFSVNKFKDYGKLSNQRPENMLEGVRVEVEKDKKEPLDFALWKLSKDDEPAWDSPWGKGRPGWHIECSTMSMKYLGENFDIHGGGIDLVFPHHENEISQSEASTRKPFANYWLHNGLLTVNGEKMSKSLGNFITISDILSDYDQEVLRLFFISSHYASPQDFTYEKMDEQKKALERFYIFFDKVDSLCQETNSKGKLSLAPKKQKEKIDSLKQSFIEAMDDDFNTALAVGHLFELLTFSNKLFDDKSIKQEEKHSALIYSKDTILELGLIFGLFSRQKSESFDTELVDKLVGLLVQLREDARKNKNFKIADLIREELSKLGYVLEDGKGATSARHLQ